MFNQFSLLPEDNVRVKKFELEIKTVNINAEIFFRKQFLHKIESFKVFDSSVENFHFYAYGACKNCGSLGQIEYIDMVWYLSIDFYKIFSLYSLDAVQNMLPRVIQMDADEQRVLSCSHRVNMI